METHWLFSKKPLKCFKPRQKSNGLTQKQLKVLELQSYGQNMTEISQRLGISVETVKDFVRKIHKNLGVKNSSHAVAQALRLGLLE